MRWLRRLVRLWICSPSLAMLGTCPCRRCGAARSDLVRQYRDAYDAAESHFRAERDRLRAKRRRAGHLVNAYRQDYVAIERDLAVERASNAELREALRNARAALQDSAARLALAHANPDHIFALNTIEALTAERDAALAAVVDSNIMREQAKLRAHAAKIQTIRQNNGRS